MILRSHWLPYCNRPVLRTALPPPSEEKGSLSKVSARNGDIGIYPSEYSCSFCFACSARSAVCGRCRAFFLRVQAASDSGEPPVQPAMPRLNTYFRFLSVRLNRLKNKLLANYLRNRGNDLATVRNSAFCVAILSNNSFICKYNIFFRKYELSVAIL